MTARRAFVEYREVSVTDPLRQGDVLEAVDPAASKWQRHLLVMTADCDFANGKHHLRVTCVPLLTQEEYLMEFRIPQLRDRVVSKNVSALQTLISSVGGPWISEDRLKEWPIEEGSDEIVAALALTGGTRDDAEKLLSAIKTATQLPVELDGSVRQLVEAQTIVPSGKKAATAQREATDVLKAHYSQPPGDALFLSAVAPTLDHGYFVYLRHLEQILEPDIAIGPTRTNASYRRLARLQDRFIHAVSQQFAMVFMAIGLPREYEEIRDLYRDLLGERYQ